MKKILKTLKILNTIRKKSAKLIAGLIATAILLYTIKFIIIIIT